MTKLLNFENVSKSLGGQAIVHELSFSAGTGEILVLLGPNGAGKSTTMNLATGLISADAGSILLNAQPISRTSALADLGYCPQDPHFPVDMKVGEIFELVTCHYPRKNRDVIEAFGLKKIWLQASQFLSGGQKRILSLALAFCGDAPVVILDEPTVGLDTEIRRLVWEYCREYSKRGKAILMTTHYLDEAESLASRILLMRKGRILRDGSALDIHLEFGFTRITFSLSSRVLIETTSTEEIAKSLSLPPEAQHIFNNQFSLDTKNVRKSLSELLAIENVEIESVKPISLEEVLKKLEMESQ